MKATPDGRRNRNKAVASRSSFGKWTHTRGSSRKVRCQGCELLQVEKGIIEDSVSSKINCGTHVPECERHRVW